MSWLHYQASVTMKTEIWHLRFYTMLTEAQQKLSGYQPGWMNTHWTLIQKNAPVPVQLDSRLVVPGFGERGMSTGTELFTGPEYQNLKVSLYSDPVLAPLVNAARDFNFDVWLEIVVEQSAMNVPDVKSGAMYWPRKNRLYFWGKMIRPEMQGTVDTQEYVKPFSTPPGIVWQRTSRDHPGKLDFTFVHWLKNVGSRSVRPWLDVFRGATNAQPFVKASDLFYSLVGAISPGPLYAMSDARLTPLDGIPGTDSCFYGNLLLPGYTIVSDAPTIAATIGQILIPRTINAAAVFVDGPYWDNSLSPGPASLYALKDLSEAIVRMSSEWEFDFQVELPTMEEAALFVSGPLGINVNSPTTVANHWISTVRWLFTAGATGHFELDPKAATIQYNPCFTWLSAAKCDMPTPKDTGPDHGYVSLNMAPELQNEQDSKTLFRFRTWHSTAPGAKAYDTWSFSNFGTLYSLSGFDLWTNVGGTIAVANDVNIQTPFGTVLAFDNWGQFHAWLTMARWGMGNATVEFDHYGRGLETFGASTKNPLPPIASFGTKDIGDFPLSRVFVMNPGLLFDATGSLTANNVMGDFIIYEITHRPGENTHIKAIELANMWNSPLVITGPDGPPPPDNVHPLAAFSAPTTGSTVSGTTTITITGSDNVAVTRVKLYLNSQLFDFLEAPNSGSNYQFSWNTTKVPNATGYILLVNAFDAAGNMGSATITVNVLN